MLVSSYDYRAEDGKLNEYQTLHFFEVVNGQVNHLVISNPIPRQVGCCEILHK